MNMVPYAEWELPEEILEKYRQTTAASKIAKYIKEEGHEPESVVPFFDLSDDEIETIKRRAYAEFEMMEFSTPIDLSLYDENRLLRTYGQTTANSYIVKTAGTYLIPLVYGNAISQGATNSAAYTKISGDYTHAFVNYLNSEITSPFIEIDTGNNATGAELTIADTDGVFDNIELVNGDICRYIQFEVKTVPSTNANGVISVINGSTVMWSWFICVRSEGISVSEYTNHDGLNLSLMDFNLGDLYDEDGIHTKNWFWQWGRPIPQICPAAYNSTENHLTTGSAVYSNESTSPSISYALQHPECFFLSNNTTWYSEDIVCYNLWDASRSAKGIIINSVKSIYDPCPPGFKVAIGTAFNGFTAGGESGSGSAINVVGKFDNGYNFKREPNDNEGRFYSASGYRVDNDGALNIVGTGGNYWTSSVDEQRGGFCLGFYTNYVLFHQFNYASGMSIRGQVGF